MLRPGSRRPSNDAGDGCARYARLCGALAAFALWAGSPGVAAADTAPVHVPYTAPAGCPDASAFDAELAKRIAARPGGRAASEDDPRRFSVRIERRNGAFEGQLTVAHQGAVGTRQVRGADCAAVVRSLAVFVALALAERPESAPDEAAPREDETPPPSSPPLRPAPGLEEPARPPVASTEPAKPALPNVWRFDAGVQAEYSRAGANAFGARVSAEWSRHFASSPIFPALRLSWGFSDFDRAVDFGGEIHSRLRTGRAELCGGVLWGRTRNALCGAFEVGQLAVTSSGLPLTGRAESSWSAGGLLARTRVTIVDPIGVELAVGLFAPFQRAEFTLIEPVRQAYRVPAVTFDGQLGIAVSTTWK